MMMQRGTRIEKCNSVPGEDGHKDGDQGTILTACSMADLKFPSLEALAQDIKTEGIYFIEWDDLPHIPVATADYRVKEIKPQS